METVEYNGYRIAGQGEFALVKIMAKGSGDIPAPLKGLWTNVGLAKQAIDQYLSSLVTNKRTRRVKVDAKEESAATG